MTPDKEHGGHYFLLWKSKKSKLGLVSLAHVPKGSAFAYPIRVMYGLVVGALINIEC